MLTIIYIYQHMHTIKLHIIHNRNSPTCFSDQLLYSVRQQYKGMHNTNTILTRKKVKVKQSRNRPGVAQRVPGGLGSQIFMTFGTWRWWGRQPHAPVAFTPRRYAWYSFSLGAESTSGHGTFGRNMSLKNTVTTPGIDPGTVRVVAQILNHYTTARPHIKSVEGRNLRNNT